MAIYRAADGVATITQEDSGRIISALGSNRGSLQFVERLPTVAGEVDVATHGITSPHQWGHNGKTDGSEGEDLPFVDRRGIIMVGNGANPSNAVSAAWFVNEVWPLARPLLDEWSDDEVTFTLVGADWDSNLARHDGVEIVGFLRDFELAALLARSKVFASPIVGSTGLNTKNILALEHGTWMAHLTK